jgi:phosphoheptose isomerase
MGLINIGFASIDHEEFKKAAELIWLTSISNHRNNIYTIGNGASASIAQHWACDYTKGCKKGGLRPRVISLAANIPLMTAVANDISYDDVYSFQLDALGQEGDVLVAISSSGNSPNVVKAIEILQESLQLVANQSHNMPPVVDLLEFKKKGPRLAVWLYTSTENYWQVYFDANRIIANVLLRHDLKPFDISSEVITENIEQVALNQLKF